MTNENPFTTAKQSLIINPKTVSKQAFHYQHLTDLENLIGFVGTEPKVKIVNGKMVIIFGKHEIKEGTIILRNSFGQVTDVLTYEQANDLYEIKAQSEFKAEHKNKVVQKPVIKKVSVKK
jgi:hypothetical protein